MLYEEKNELGSISINTNIIENVCGRIVDQFDGNLIVSDAKGRLRKGAINKPEEETGFLVARYDRKLLRLRLYVIIKFGVSINKIVADFEDKIREEMPKTIGIEVGRVRVVVVGTLSKNLTKRNIEIVDDNYQEKE